MEGNKSAGTRARKSAQELKNLLQDLEKRNYRREETNDF